MASNYPGSLDSFDTIASDKKTSDAVGGRTHRAMHNDLGDAIEAVQAELGTDPAGASATVKARFEVIEANDWVTSARIAADAVGSSEIAAGAVGTAEIADAAVTTAGLADGAVTRAKLAGNLLTATQSNFEVDTTGWAASNVTLTRTTASYKSGAASMRVASSTDTSTTKRARTSTRPAVTAGKTYTICASLKGDGTTSYRLTVLWYNAASGGSIVGTVNGNYTTASAGWFDERMELVAPSGATHCEINVYVDNATLTGGYVDVAEVGIWEGVGGSWAAGGTATDATGVPFVKTLYVDTATGAAANPGTAALPVAKLSQAVTLAGVTASTIKVKSTASAPVRETAVVSLPTTLPSVTIESGYAGRPWYFSGSTPVTSGWTDAGGGVYSRSQSVSTNGVYVTSLSETIGDRTFTKTLTKNTGTPTTPGEGEFGWSSNVLYVKLPSSADPASHTVQIPNATYSIQSHCPTVTIRDARILYSNWTAVDVEAGNLTAYDSVVMHVGSTGCAWATSGTANMTLHRCYGWRANNDGFNVHGSGNTLLIDCDGSYNDDEGASAHETTYMEIIGGRYRYNVQAGTGNVGTSTAVIGGNALFEYNQRSGTASPEAGGIASFEDCTTIIMSATCANNTGSGVRSTSSVAVQVDGLLSGTGQGNTSADYGI